MNYFSYIEEKTNDKALLVATRLCLTFEGMHRIKSDGLVYPYLCPAGFPTQGVGQRISSLNNPPITQETALDWLLRTLEKNEASVLRCCPVLLRRERALGAIIDFCYNLGVGRLQASTLRRRINQEDWPEAKKELGKWIRGGGRILPGLVKRRSAEALYLD